MTTKKKAVQAKKIHIGLVLRSREAWAALAASSKSPGVSFKLMKYHRDTLDTLFRVIDDQRNEYIKKFAPESDGPPMIDPKKTPEAYQQFVDTFSEYLQVETDLTQIDMTLEHLVDDLSKFDGNSVSEQTLMLIEPFFKAA